MFGVPFLDFTLEEEIHVFEYEKKGVGKGHSMNGKRKGWKKNNWFEQDLLGKFQREMSDTTFKATYAGYTAADISWFFSTIEKKLIRPKETVIHARNKVLLWLDKLHNCLSGQQMKDKYKIGVKTAYSHIQDVLKAIILSYSKESIIKFPPVEQRQQMVNILKKRNVSMPDALFAIDGSHTRCTGRGYTERLSHKYKWLPCFNVMFVVERVFGTICAFNLDQAASKHDITVLRESSFFNEVEEIMDGWIILADKGYIGVYKDVECIAAVLKRNSKGRNAFSKEYWRSFNVARADVERSFADFFSNKFTQLGKWPGKSKQTFVDFSKNVICCIILYNIMKMKRMQLCPSLSSG